MLTVSKCKLMTSGLALLVALGGYAQERSTQSRQQSQGSRYQQDQQQTRTQQTIRGKIDAFRHIDRQTAGGARQTHSLLRLQLEDGEMVVVDLGPKRNLDQLNLQQGDQIQISGRYAMSGGRQVFVADRLRVNGQTLTVQRQGTQAGGQQFTQRQQQQQQRGREPIYTAGTVEGFKHINVRNTRGQQQTHTLVRLGLDSGRTVVANLGPKSRLQELNLEKGDRLRIQGHRGTLDQRPIFLVDRIKIVDQTGQTGQQTRRSRPPGQDRQQTTRRGEQFTLSGTVQGYQVMSIDSRGKEYVLLNLQLEDGRSVIIDAGEYQPGELNLKDLNLQDQVTIQARRTQSNGREVLRADNISFQEPMGGTSEQQGSSQQSKQSKSGKQSQQQQSKGSQQHSTDQQQQQGGSQQ